MKSALGAEDTSKPTSLGTKSTPLVITTVNPHGPIEWQSKCIASFQSSGHDVISVNHRSEINKLREGGISSGVLSVEDEETGLSIYGKAIPNVLSALKRAREYGQRDYYILVNSDIYYAGSKPCVKALLKGTHAAASTRTDICDPEIIHDDSGRPYRNGLDIFVFSKHGLDNFINELDNNPEIAKHMVFGIPGWDYVAGIATTKTIGGIILDCKLFKHKTHKQAYSSISAFESMMPYIKTRGIAIEDSAHVAAAQCVEYITMECKSNKAHSQVIELAYTCHKSGNGNILHKGNGLPKPITIPPEILGNTSHLLDELYGRDKQIRIKKAIKSIYFHGEPEMIAIKNLFLTGNSYRMQSCQLILCSTLLMRLRSQKSNLTFTTLYPKENSHKACLDLIERVTGLEEKLYHLTDLFYTELLEYNIYNAPIMMLLVSHQTDKEYLNLIKEQIDIIKANLR